jgi:hypothetical protein
VHVKTVIEHFPLRETILLGGRPGALDGTLPWEERDGERRS